MKNGKAAITTNDIKNRMITVTATGSDTRNDGKTTATITAGEKAGEDATAAIKPGAAR